MLWPRIEAKLSAAVDDDDVRHRLWLRDTLGDEVVDLVVLSRGVRRLLPSPRRRRRCTSRAVGTLTVPGAWSQRQLLTGLAALDRRRPGPIAIHSRSAGGFGRFRRWGCTDDPGSMAVCVAGQLGDRASVSAQAPPRGLRAPLCETAPVGESFQGSSPVAQGLKARHGE